MDLTAITTPFGLLDAETQEALKTHGGPYECWSLGGACKWQAVTWDFDWLDEHVYRVKPAPPREFWLRFDMNGNAPIVYGTVTEPVTPDGFVVHVREVLPE